MILKGFSSFGSQRAGLQHANVFLLLLLENVTRGFFVFENSTFAAGSAARIILLGSSAPARQNESTEDFK